MFQDSYKHFLIMAAGFVFAAILTYLVRGAAHKFGFVAKPKLDRWHKKPTAMFGGYLSGNRFVLSGVCAENFRNSRYSGRQHDSFPRRFD
jgi:UDP-N-acetylmuramyl pentapeptide phosphotransferase/UDP-N-acetylglucosamine-1-phosphate transferase